MFEEFRCTQCNKLLARGEALALDIKCPRCGAVNRLRTRSPYHESQEPQERRRDNGKRQASATST
jgi:phage FluMu protein Com